MGSSASKAARKYPQRQGVPGLGATGAGSKATEAGAVPRSRPADNVHGREALEKDGGDPDFLAMLNRLGPVRVDHHMQTVRPEHSNTTRLFESRNESESQASSSQPVQNHLYSSALSELLDRRKSASTTQDLERLSKEFGLDLGDLERLARFVNSPSVSSSTIRPVGEKEDQGFTITAAWIEPVSPEHRRPSSST
ncbi:hypothetical protein B0H34DRAFT_794760 [Crassisporium funariophilum]|nr:hypothetical protein B0H34DRAFT_794760 [Crassisporium funariophilum]